MARGVFLWKKLIGIVAAFGFCLLVCLCFTLTEQYKIPFVHDFYFVCRYHTDNEVSGVAISDSVKNNGGAGYVWEYDGRINVVVSCYEKQQDAQYVCQKLNERGENCDVKEIHTKQVTLQKRNKNYREKIVGIYTTLYENFGLLYRTANLLDEGECTIEQAQNTVIIFKNQLQTLKKQGIDVTLSLRLDKLLGYCDDTLGDIVMARNVRFLQVALADEMIRGANGMKN